jgi:hypothetical protein
MNIHGCLIDCLDSWHPVYKERAELLVCRLDWVEDMWKDAEHMGSEAQVDYSN